MSATSGNERCCQAVSDCFRRLFCVTQVLNLFSAWIPCMKGYDARERRLSSVYTWENNNGPTTVNECSRFLTCDKCHRMNLRGHQGKYVKEVAEDVASGCGKLGGTTAGADDASAVGITGETGTPALERCGHFLNLHDACHSAETTSSTVDKRNTYPPITQTSRRTQSKQKFRRLLTTAESSGPLVSGPTAETTVGADSRRGGHGVVILRGYRDIMTLIHPSYCQGSGDRSPEKVLKTDEVASSDSQSSASSEDCPPWLPESQLSGQRARHFASAERRLSHRARPLLVARRVAAGGRRDSAGRRQWSPLPAGGEDGEAGGTSPVVELWRGGARFIRRPGHHQAPARRAALAAPAGGGGGRRRRPGTALSLALRRASRALWRSRRRCDSSALPRAQVRRAAPPTYGDLLQRST